MSWMWWILIVGAVLIVAFGRSGGPPDAPTGRLKRGFKSIRFIGSSARA